MPVTRGLVAGWVVLALAAGSPWPAVAVPLHPDLLARDPEAARRLAPEPAVERAPPGLAGTASVGPGYGRRLTMHPRFLVLLLDFPDRPAARGDEPLAAFTRFFFSRGEMETGSVRDWYDDVSGGRFVLTGEVRGWLDMPRPYTTYLSGVSGVCAACYPNNARGLAADAVRAAEAAGIDFARFDNDGPDGLPGSGDDDGIVDGLVLVFPGWGSERTGHASDFRSHYWNTVGGVTVGSIAVPDYVLVPERENIGVAVHEIGHLLGAEDLYDLSGRGAGLGDYSVMAHSAWFVNGLRPGGPDPFTRMEWGFVTPRNVLTDEPGVEIPCIHDEPAALRLWRRGAEGPEYFLVENRCAEGVDALLPGEGLLVYHVDETQPAQRDPNRYRVSLVQADGLHSLEGNYPRNLGEAGDYFPGTHGVRELDDDTVPGTRDYDGAVTGVALRGIGDPGPVITADVDVGLHVFPYPSPRLVVAPEDGALSSGLAPGAGAVQVAVVNDGIRLGPGRFRIFSRDASVTVSSAEWDVPGIDPLDRFQVEIPVPLDVRHGPGRPLRILEGVYETDSGSYALVAPLPLAADVALHEDFEEPPGTYATGPAEPGGVDPWLRTGPASAEGRWGMGTLGYPDYADGVLLPGRIEERGWGELRFRHRINTPVFGAYVYDGGFLEISRDGGVWTLLEPSGGYPHHFGFSSGNAYPGLPVWGGESDWADVVVPLGWIEGRTAIRFHFVSDYSGSHVNYEGWSVDEVRVRVWERQSAAVFDPPEVADGEVTISFETIPVVGPNHPSTIRLLREAGDRRDVLGSWSVSGRHREAMTFQGLEAGRVDRFWLESEEGETGPLVVVHPGSLPAELMSGTPAYTSRAAPEPIRLRVPGVEPMIVELDLFDVRGRRVSRLVEGELLPGWHNVPFPGPENAPAAGVYFLRAAGEGFVESRRIIVLP